MSEGASKSASASADGSGPVRRDCETHLSDSLLYDYYTEPELILAECERINKFYPNIFTEKALNFIRGDVDQFRRSEMAKRAVVDNLLVQINEA